MKKREFQICSKTVLDTSIPGIRFDENGVCQYVKVFKELEKRYPLGEEGNKRLENLVNRIKKDGKNNKYDCIVGVSGGTDSTYTLYQAKKYGLRPLAVHFDNGWNSKLAVQNIKKTCEQLNVDLFTYVVDWQEFRSLQIAFLKASTPDAEIPTDVGIHATLIKTAAKEKVKYVLNGHSFRTEFMMPIGWTYMDGKYIVDVNKKYGVVKLKSYPNFTLSDLLYYNMLKAIKVVPFLNFFDYSKKDAKILLKEELDWTYSGGHHHESIYTRFFQSYYLPQKFGIDKRKTELSAEILSGTISRKEALDILDEPYEFDPENVKYVLGKLELSTDDFDQLMKEEIRSFHDFQTYFPLVNTMKPFISLATNLNLLPKVLYYKYFEA